MVRRCQIKFADSALVAGTYVCDILRNRLPVFVLLYQRNSLHVTLSDAINAKCFEKLKSGLNEIFLAFLLFVRGSIRASVVFTKQFKPARRTQALFQEVEFIIMLIPGRSFTNLLKRKKKLKKKNV